MSVDAMTAPAAISGEADPDATGSFRRRWDEGVAASPPPIHPVKDIVLPLAVVIMLCTNALMIGIAWGRFSQRMDTYETNNQALDKRLTKQEDAAQGLRDRMHDAERDLREGERRFGLLDDYTRGRIDRLPYHAPPPARW